MPMFTLGVAFLLFGAVSVWEALRIGGTLRSRGTLDLIGPDRYLLGVAVLLLVVGVILLIQGAYAARRSRTVQPAAAPPMRSAPVNGHASVATTDAPVGNAHLWLLGTLFAYAVLLQVLGYLLATVAFTAATFRIMGTKSWWTTLIGAIVLTGVCYASFLWIADLPLPRGMLGIG